MSGAIQKALDEIFFQIPIEVLQLAFTSQNIFLTQRQVSIPAMIREEVIERRVRIDLDCAGASQVAIPLTGLVPEYLDQYTRVFIIPASLTDGRSISATLSVSFGQYGMYGYPNALSQGQFSAGMPGTDQSVLTNMIDNLNNARRPIAQVSSANVRLIAENTVMITEVIQPTAELYLNCLLGSDQELTHIQPPYWPMFSELVVWATKAYVYRKLNIQLDTGALVGGQGLGRIREVVDGYSDAEQTYQDMRREKLGKMLFLNDPTRRKQHLRLLIGGGN